MPAQVDTLRDISRWDLMSLSRLLLVAESLSLFAGLKRTGLAVKAWWMKGIVFDPESAVAVVNPCRYTANLALNPVSKSLTILRTAGHFLDSIRMAFGCA